MEHSRGFTLIELTMAILFISFLILAVGFISVNVGNMYQKGTTLKAVNQSGREVADTMRRDIMQAGNSIKVATPGNGNTIRWCLGTVSYVANKASLINNNPAQAFKVNGEVARLVRMSDPSQSICSASPAYPMSATTTDAVDLLGSATPALAIYDMKLTSLTGSAQQSLHEVSFLLGTAEKGIVSASNYCLPNTNPNANANYCSVVEFKTIIRSGGSQ
ncbi:MAG TPA: hypothetical protein PKD19_02655 [Candidatus Saccharibacteria bacterium]|nr:hypothetical protein [Candidatus Saccharibacteria bacterium]HMR38536.1 hypothetical protein [Candidatus Saccharibacteria bacterium]